MKKILLLIAFALCTNIAYSQPSTISYQGVLTNEAGALINGSRDLTFRVYDASTVGNLLATNTYNGVSITNGLFNVELSLGAINYAQDLWLEIEVAGTTLTPRVKFNATGYALASPNNGMDNFTGSYYLYDTKAGVKLSPNNSAPNVDLVLQPKGTGALIADQPDGAIAGGNIRGSYSVDLQMLRGLATQVASGAGATISGGYENTANGDESTVSGGYRNTASSSNSTVGGGEVNSASGSYSIVGGGYNNTASGNHSSVGGGYMNIASGNHSSVDGGYMNIASGNHSSVDGGYNNTAGVAYSSVGGGYNNTASGELSSVDGGFKNTAGGEHSSVGGGYMNIASGMGSFVGGGTINSSSGDFSSVVGGIYNTAQSFGETVLGIYATVGAGNATSRVDGDRLFVVGNGTAEASRSNALTILKNGNTTISGGVQVGFTTYNTNGNMSGLINYSIIKYTYNGAVTNLPPAVNYAGKILYVINASTAARTINGSNVADGKVIQLISDGTNWFTVTVTP